VIGRTCSKNEGKKNAYGLLMGKPGGKRPLGRPKRRRVGEQYYNGS
jgi:hypothetical protein